MARRDQPQLRLWRLRLDAVEELGGLHLPSPQVRPQDRRLRVIRDLFDADHLALAAPPELAAAGGADIPHPFGLPSRRDQVTRTVELEQIHRRRTNSPGGAPGNRKDP